MLKKLSNIQKDKLLHFFWGAILSFILILFFGKIGIIRAIITPIFPRKIIRIKERIAPQKKCKSLSF